MSTFVSSLKAGKKKQLDKIIFTKDIQQQDAPFELNFILAWPIQPFWADDFWLENKNIS